MIDFLSLIYPNVCGFCGDICKKSLCNKCRLDIEKYKTNIVFFKTKNKYFNEYENIFKYEGEIREKIIKYKFQNKAYLYKTFASIILNNQKTYRFLQNYDIIIPIPIHKKRKLQRGYNQTELIAKEISNNTNLVLQKNVLKKSTNVVSQSTLTKSKREQNVKNVFSIINKDIIAGKRVLVFDDIYTTGSTVNEASKVLKKAEAKSIGVLTIAKD